MRQLLLECSYYNEQGPKAKKPKVISDPMLYFDVQIFFMGK